MAPATPTGLMVSETTETSITWTWDAVEGATAYAVQQSTDEMFDETDMVSVTLETTHTASDLEPETSVFIRVAAAVGTLEDHVLSGWTTHVTGMSAMPVPEPEPVAPAPDPVMVAFTAPEGKFPMVPDDGRSEATAMASVNTKMMVMSNTTAVITPMFVDDAAGVSVMAADDNMPFAYVDWSLLQSAVVTDGATFMVQRTTMGANQEMEPTGDVAYVTCGPFACTEGMDPPEILEDSAVCAAWDPDLTLQVGLIDNDVFRGADTPEETTAVGNDGIDLGWLTTSTASMDVKHVFSGVAKGQNFSVSGPGAGTGTDLPLKMDRSTNQTADTIDNQLYKGAIAINQNDTEDTDADSVSACVAITDETGAYTYTGTIGANHRPDNCFRLSAVHDSANYLSGYSVEVSAKDSEVAWGDVAWKEDPFDGLECESTTFVAADQVDICEMFEAEVDQAMDAAKGWGGRFGTVNHEIVAGKVDLWKVALNGAAPDRFKTLWFDDDLDGKIRTSSSDTTANRARPERSLRRQRRRQRRHHHRRRDRGCQQCGTGDTSREPDGDLAAHARCRRRSPLW